MKTMFRNKSQENEHTRTIKIVMEPSYGLYILGAFSIGLLILSIVLKSQEEKQEIEKNPDREIHQHPQ